MSNFKVLKLIKITQFWQNLDFCQNKKNGLTIVGSLYAATVVLLSDVEWRVESFSYLFPAVRGEVKHQNGEKWDGHFSNIEQTRTCSSIGDRTRTPYFWLPTIKHQTSSLIGLSLDWLQGVQLPFCQK